MFVHELLERSARRRPQAPALVAAGCRWSYRELVERVGSLAVALRERGVRAGERVAVDLGNRPEAVVAIWATLAAGGAFVCLDPTSPRRRFLDLIDDFSPRVLLTTGERLSAVQRPRLPEIVLSVGTGATGGVEPLETFMRTGGRRWPRLGDDATSRLANLVYTSGSTGAPKGVMMTHGSMGAAISAITTYLRAAETDVTLCLLPLSFDYGLYQVLMTGAMGGRLILGPGFGYPGELLETLRDEHVTTLPGVPTLFALLLRLRRFEAHELPHLTTFTNTGAALPVAHTRALRNRFPHALIYLMYGLTECKRVSYLPPERVDTKPRSVGVPMPGCEIAIVDPEGRRVLPGQEGELVVRGPSLMAGYWRRPVATAQALRPGPWSGERCLYTGDRFCADGDGDLHFVTRTDDVLKCRGQKVAPGEVEDELLGHDDVSEAAVVGVDHPVFGQAIRAAVVLEPGGRATPDALRRWCARRLESFKVPHEVLIVEELPRGSRGKVDRGAVRALAATAPERSKEAAWSQR